jgi:TetR/AcrR family transcriptional repressor of nem operon
MPYTKQHKQRTRERIVTAAAHAFRAEGVHGVAIPTVMREAGLTHGGFYAHFASKDALVAAACAQGFLQSGDGLLAVASKAAPEDQLGVIVRGYLSTAHRDAPQTGCVIPTVGPEIARAPEEVRRAFTDALEDYLARLEPFMSAATSAERREQATILLSGMAGAVLLSRMVSDQALSDMILRQARHFYPVALAHTPANTATPSVASSTPSGEAGGGATAAESATSSPSIDREGAGS